jgi:hypothetical protein
MELLQEPDFQPVHNWRSHGDGLRRDPASHNRERGKQQPDILRRRHRSSHAEQPARCAITGKWPAADTRPGVGFKPAMPR